MSICAHIQDKHGATLNYGSHVFLLLSADNAFHSCLTV
jgi:hypothetical protein